MTVTRAWILLLLLSAITTALATSGADGYWRAPVILFLAGIKADTILNQYLRLSQAPAIARGFTLVLAFFLALLTLLAMAA